MQPSPPMAAWMPPPRPSNGQIVAGGVLVFVGFLLLGLASISSALTRYEFVGVLYGFGDFFAAAGFLIAFLGLARRP